MDFGESSSYFDELLGPSPPVRLANLAGNPTDKALRDRKELQKEYVIASGHILLWP